MNLFKILKRWLIIVICILITNTSVSQEYKEKSITTYIDSIASLEKPTNNILTLAEKKLLAYDTITLARELGDAYYKLGKLHYGKEQYTKAIAVSKKAVSLLKKTKDSLLLHKTLNNLYHYYGKVKDNIKDTRKNQLIVLHQIINNKIYDKYTFGAYNKATLIYIDNGDYYKALRYADYVIKMPEIHHNYPKLFVIAHINSIEVYKNLKLNPNQLYTIEHHNREIEKYSEHTNQKNIAAKNNNLAIIYVKLKQYKEAIIYFEKALPSFLETNNFEELGNLYNNLGVVYFELKNTQKATEYLNKALKISNHKKVLSSVVHNKGFYLETTKSIKKIPYYQESIKHLLGDEYQYTLLHELPKIEAIQKSAYAKEILENLIQIANTWVLSYKENEDISKLLYAKETLFLIDKLISYIRLESSVDQSKLFWIDKGVDTYMLGVEICYLLEDTEKAFYFMEKNKSLLMLENLSDVSKQNLTITSFENVKNDYVTDTSNFIEYILNEKEGYGIFSSTTETAFFKIENVPALIQQVATLKKQCSTRFSNKEDGVVYAKNAHSIFQKLFPFEEALQKIAGKKLTIVSDYTIKNIPFEALTTNDKADAIKESFLINQTEISYLHSASVSNQLQQKERKPNAMVLGVAPAIFKMDSLVALDNSIEDIKQIASFFPTKILKKEEATKTNVVVAMSDYKVIHLNTHAGLDELTGEPWIALYDKKIRLEELYHQPIQADLVVLDACKSASGKLEMGEGIMSLSRGFTYNGAASVIASQWNANEAVSSKIFKTFYKELHSGSSKSKALHQAKLTYLNNNQLSEISPYYWATMMLTGNAEPIEIQQTSYKWIVFLLIGIGILGLVYFFYTKK